MLFAIEEIGPISFSELSVFNDIETITADYLIKNIDHAFMVWEKSPWKENISFSIFCEEILPYRIGDEPLEDWREIYYNYFQPILDSLLTDNSPLTAVQIIYDFLISEDWAFFTDFNTPHRGALNLFNYRIGGCMDLCDFSLYIMRALGIPGGIDLILQNPDKMYGVHYWNYVRDNDGNCIDFTLYEHRPNLKERIPDRKKGKVYRQFFGIQPTSLPLLYPKANIPVSLKSFYLKDVSYEYFDVNNLSFKINTRNLDDNLVYLNVFNNRIWIPITWTKLKSGKAIFTNIEKNIAYLPTFAFDSKTYQADYPIILRESGKVQTMIPDITNLQTIYLHRKHPQPEWWNAYSERAIGGRFQMSNDEFFENPINIYTIENECEMIYYSIDIDLDKPYQFIRYLSAENGYCNMAEIEFIDKNGNELFGKIIGTNGSYKNSQERTKYAVFDKDPLTFYDANEPSEAWVGMDFGQPVYVNQIRYLFRNDDNNIRENDEYELFFFTKTGVKSLGKKIGTKEGILIYQNVPSNSLFLLHNYTRGNEERIFTYENGQQIWW